MRTCQGHGSPCGPLIRSLAVGSALLLGAQAAHGEEPPVPAGSPVASSAPKAAQDTSPPGEDASPPASVGAAPSASVAALPPVRSGEPSGVQLGPSGAPPKVESPYRYPGIRIAGIVVTGVGLGVLTTGGALMLAGFVKSQPRTCSADMCGVAELVYGLFVIIGSSPFIVVGTPLWITGSVLKKEPVPLPDKAISLLPQAVSVGPGSVGLRWSF